MAAWVEGGRVRVVARAPVAWEPALAEWVLAEAERARVEAEVLARVEWGREDEEPPAEEGRRNHCSSSHHHMVRLHHLCGTSKSTRK